MVVIFVSLLGRIGFIFWNILSLYSFFSYSCWIPWQCILMKLLLCINFCICTWAINCLLFNRRRLPLSPRKMRARSRREAPPGPTSSPTQPLRVWMCPIDKIPILAWEVGQRYTSPTVPTRSTPAASISNAVEAMLKTLVTTKISPPLEWAICRRVSWREVQHWTGLCLTRLH